MVARNAVGRPPTARSTLAPCFSRNSVSHACAFSSLKQSSGLSWILSDSASRSSASRSTAPATCCFTRGRRAHFVLLNSSCARLTRPGSVRRSSVVIAIAFAAVSVPVRASGLTAAASNARE